MESKQKVITVTVSLHVRVQCLNSVVRFGSGFAKKVLESIAWVVDHAGAEDLGHTWVGFKVVLRGNLALTDNVPAIARRIEVDTKVTFAPRLDRVRRRSQGVPVCGVCLKGIMNRPQIWTLSDQLLQLLQKQVRTFFKNSRVKFHGCLILARPRPRDSLLAIPLAASGSI